MKSAFIIQHMHLLSSGEPDIKFVGVYSSRGVAEKAVSRLASKPGFSECPQVFDHATSDTDEGFHIDEYMIDEDNWSDGFITL